MKLQSINTNLKKVNYKKIILLLGMSSFGSVLITLLLSCLKGWDFRLFYNIAVVLVVISLVSSYLLLWKVKLVFWKKLLFTVGVIFAGFIILFSISFIFTRVDEFLIINSERKKLESIPSVETVELKLNVDEYGPQSSNAILNIKGGRKLTIFHIGLYGPHGGDGIFNSGSIYLCSIGSWHLYSYDLKFGIEKKQNCVDVGGSDWNFYNQHFLRLPINNIPDLVKQHDNVLKVIESWPKDFCASDPQYADYTICVGKTKL